MSKQITVQGRAVTLAPAPEFTLIPDFTVGANRKVTISTPNKYSDTYTASVKGNRYAHDLKLLNGKYDFVRTSMFDPNLSNSVPAEVSDDELAFLGALCEALNAEFAAEKAARKAAQQQAATNQLKAQEEKLKGFENVQIFD